MKASALLLGLDRPRRAWAFALLTGGGFLACWLLFPAAKAACGCVFLLGMIAGSCVDFDRMVIPDLFTVGLALTGIALSFAVPALHGLGAFGLFNCLRSGAAALLGRGSRFGPSDSGWAFLGELVLDREVLGFGDVKFLGAIGAFCGWQGAVFSLFGGALVGALALALGELHRRVVGGKAVRLFRVESPGGETSGVGWGAHFPFGPMLAIAGGIYFLMLHPCVDRYLAQYKVLF